MQKPNKRDYDFLSGAEITLRKNGKVIYTRESDNPVEPIAQAKKEPKKARKPKAQPKQEPKTYANIHLKEVDK